jgi:hypothetical protein
MFVLINFMQIEVTATIISITTNFGFGDFADLITRDHQIPLGFGSP